LFNVKIGNPTKEIKIHTNNIENLWSRLRRKTESFYGINQKHFAGVIDECVLLLDLKCYSKYSVVSLVNIIEQVRLHPVINNQVSWHIDKRKRRYIVKKMIIPQSNLTTDVPNEKPISKTNFIKNP